MKPDALTHDMRLSVGSVVKYRMTVPSGDTMFALVDEVTGLLVIHEYDGTWGHWWNPDHIGKQTFVEFLRSTRSDYLASKLVPYEKQRAIDVEATVKAHQRAAIDAGHGDDEALMEDIENTDWEQVAVGAERNPLDEADIDGDHWNLIEYEDSRWLIMVRDICIPMLKRALEEEAKR